MKLSSDDIARLEAFLSSYLTDGRAECAKKYGVHINETSGFVSGLRRFAGAKIPRKYTVQKGRTARDFSEWFEKGLSYTEIAEQAKVSRGYVRQMANKYGYRGPRSRAVVRERNRELIESVAAGETIADAAARTGRPIKSVRDIAVKAKVCHERADKREAFLRENAERFEAIRAGASIGSQAINRTHQNRLERECKRLGIVSIHGRWPQNKQARAERAS